MDALKKATDKPLIIINESMQFSAGVNLTYTMNFADKGDFKSIEKFVKYFQDTCKELKYSKFPVVSAPSGLTLGGGFEVLVQSNFVASHTNIVIGLVETMVGLVPQVVDVKKCYGDGLKLKKLKMIQILRHLKFLILLDMEKQQHLLLTEPLKYLLRKQKNYE